MNNISINPEEAYVIREIIDGIIWEIKYQDDMINKGIIHYPEGIGYYETSISIDESKRGIIESLNRILPLKKEL